jgi:hypothetical protein
MIKKFVAALTLALSAVAAFAAPIAFVDFKDGRLYLTDEVGKCPEGLPSWKFQANDLKETEGCWAAGGGDVFVFHKDGTPITSIPVKEFIPIKDTQVKGL